MAILAHKLNVVEIPLSSGGQNSKMMTNNKECWLRTTYSEFSFWVRGVLSRCSGVVTMAFWLHTGVDVSDGFSRS